MTCKDTCDWGSPQFSSHTWSMVECRVCGDIDAVRTKPGVTWPDWSTAVEFTDAEANEEPKEITP